ncbi:MAG: terminase [Lachnospiraceae bacterium]|nr:terminase [Lachnospiraceae bacterium]
MAAKLKGSQTPSRSVFLTRQERKKTEYLKAVELYERTGKKCLKWQTNLNKHILAKNNKGLWTHTKVGYSIPRRNGKSEVLVQRELYGLEEGEQILHTAHRTTTSHASWERLCRALNKLGYVNASETRRKDDVPEEKLYDSYKANGLESVTLRKTGGRVNFRTRTSKGGLGEGYDTLIIDEAQEYDGDQESALKYVVTDSKNPQTIMCGTPPTNVSSGTVFVKFRTDALAKKVKNAMWAEWSVDYMTDLDDREAWKRTNPSLGYFLTERAIEDEIGPDAVDFNIQRLGLWLSYNQASAISEKEWQALKLDYKPEPISKPCIGIKFGKDGKNAALACATKLSDGRIFVECLYCRPMTQGIGWILDVLSKINYAEVVADGANGQRMLEDAAKDCKLKNVKFPVVSDVINANAEFEQAVFQRKLCHSGQLSLEQVASNCKKRNIGSNGGFGYESLMDDLEIAILDAVIFAYWSCSKLKEHKVQKITY